MVRGRRGAEMAEEAHLVRRITLCGRGFHDVDEIHSVSVFTLRDNCCRDQHRCERKHRQVMFSSVRLHYYRPLLCERYIILNEQMNDSHFKYGQGHYTD